MTTPILSREDLGTPIDGYLAATKDNFVHVRSQSTVLANILGDLYRGDKLTYRPNTQKAGGLTWYAVEKPWVGWMADVGTPAPGQPAQPVLKLDVPYVSQEAADALAYRNDCGPACLLMQMRYWRSKLGWGYGNFPTVDDVSRHTALASKDGPLPLAALEDVARGYGNLLTLLHDLTPDKIIDSLKDGYPTGVLVNYGDFYPQDTFKGGHYAIITGYSSTGFWAHDPYRGGKDYAISRAQLDAALKNTSAFAATPYQGFILS